MEPTYEDVESEDAETESVTARQQEQQAGSHEASQQGNHGRRGRLPGRRELVELPPLGAAAQANGSDLGHRRASTSSTLA